MIELYCSYCTIKRTVDEEGLKIEAIPPIIKLPSEGYTGLRGQCFSASTKKVGYIHNLKSLLLRIPDTLAGLKSASVFIVIADQDAGSIHHLPVARSERLAACLIRGYDVDQLIELRNKSSILRVGREST